MQKIIYLVLLLILWVGISAGYQPALVKYIIDGDTLVVTLNQQQQTIRLLGIDTPETATNHHLQWQIKHWKQSATQLIKKGRQAKQFLTQLCQPNSQIIIVTDQKKYDHYQRLLAYVYLTNGLFVNAAMLKHNYAHIYIVPPNTKKQAQLSHSWINF